MCFAGLCTCKLGFSQDVNLCIEDIPSFTGDSWMRFRRLKAYHKFSLDLEVKSFNNDGIIFYTQQRDDGTGDFISLSIVNGYIQLSYNLGSGAVTVAWGEKIKLGVWHKVRVRRYQRDAILQVDGGRGVGVKAGGSSTGLDLGHDAWLGGVDAGADRVWTNAGTSLGLVGCLRLATALGHPLEARAVTPCKDNPCHTNPCRNHARCLADPLDPLLPTCLCSQHFTGKYCEERLSPCVYNVCGLGSTCRPQANGAFTCDCSVSQPCHHSLSSASWSFSGKSWASLGKPERTGKAFSVELWLLVRVPDGIVMYWGQQAGHADFISLYLDNGRLVFSFSLGDSTAVIRSNSTVELDRWYRVMFGRVEREGFLQIDNGTLYRGSSPGHLTELNLDTPLYLGGVPPEVTMVGGAGEGGLVGSVGRVVVNGVGRLGLEPPPGTGLTPHTGPPCHPSPCNNNATCIPNLNQFSCLCQPPFTGLTCHLTLEDENGDLGVKFDGKTVLRYPKQKHIQRKNETLLDTNQTDTNYSWEEDDYLDAYDEATDYPIYNNYDVAYVDDYQVLYEQKGTGGGCKVEVSLRPDKDWGSVVVGRGRGSAWALALHDGYPLILSATPHDITSLKSKVRVTDGLWHHVTAVHRRRSILLQVDDQPPTRLRLLQPLPPPANRFTIGGGWRNRGRLTEKGYEGRYEGCLMRVKVNGRQLDLATLLPEDHTLHYCSDNNVR